MTSTTFSGSYCFQHSRFMIFFAFSMLILYSQSILFSSAFIIIGSTTKTKTISFYHRHNTRTTTNNINGCNDRRVSKLSETAGATKTAKGSFSPSPPNYEYFYSEDRIKQMSAEALLPVFYPNAKTTANSNTNLMNISPESSPSTTTYIGAEKTLKKLLRRFQKDIQTQSYFLSYEQRQNTRKIFADLVLGTSIMRIRHFFILLSILDSGSGTVTGDLCIEDIEPINGVEEHHNHEQKKTTSSYGETHDTLLTNRLKVVRAMVDIHFDYMMNDNSQDDLQPLLLKYITSNKSSTTTTDDQEQRIISITQSLPLFFVKLMMEQYGQTLTQEITSTFNKPGPITLRLNKIKCDTQDRLRDRLWKDDNITTTDSTNMCIYKKNKEAQQQNFSHLTKQQQQHQILQLIPVNNNKNENNRNDGDGSSTSQQKSIWSLDAWKDGWFEVQDAGSQLIVDACEINGDEEIIVDYCAGNGGKTFGLASQLYDMKKKKQQQQKQQDSAEGVGRESERTVSHIIAHDVVHDRLRQIEGSFDRIGIHKHNNYDAEETIKVTTITTSMDNNNNDDEDKKIPSADVVLVDAPCSSTGVLRRRPSQRFFLDKDEIISKFPSTQISILKEASALVKKGGGRLIYATCSILHYENEDVVKNFENSIPDFDQIWKRWYFNEEERREGEKDHCLRILPSENGSDGFFIARWKRR